MKHSSKTVIILMCLIGLLHQTVKAQDATIERHYQAVFYDKTSSCYKDTTCNIFFTLKKGRVVDVSICVASYDREHVQAANISFNGNNIGTLDSFLKTIANSKDKYRDWTETAVKNNVLDFSKDMENKTSIKKHRMEINFCYDSLWYQSLKSSDRGLPMPFISPRFRVDKGTCILEIGDPQTLGERYNPRKRQGYVPSIGSAMLTESIDRQVSGARTGLIAMQFRSEDQIQSFLDAFNIDAEITAVREEYQKKKARNDSIDILFK